MQYTSASSPMLNEPPPIGPCPPDEMIDQIAGGGEPPPEVRDHISNCPRCRAEIAAVGDGEQFLSGYLAAPPPEGAATENELDISPDLLPGYRLLSVIHSGGQGVVYKAVQEATGRTVAVKMLLAGRFATPAQRRRFEREAEIAAALDHPCIVRIYDSRAVRGGRHALIMEYVGGVSLDEWSPTGRTDRERIRTCLLLMAQVCDAVEHAHRNGVIHRDLKPSNVLVEPDGRPRVVDFGVARPLRGEDAGGGSKPAITQAGEFAGSLEFASPEQVLEARDGPQTIRADARSDVYSIGVMLYDRVCGSHPYPVDGSILDVVNSIVNVPATRPSSINRAIDTDVETILLLALHKDRSRRYQSAGALAVDLRRYLVGDGIEARRDSGLYQFRKTIQRYRIPIGVGLVLLAIPVLMYVARTQTTMRRLAERATASVASSSVVDAARLTGLQRHSQIGQSQLWAVLRGTFDADANDPIAAGPYPAQRRRALWALREAYSRDPCVATHLINRPLISATITRELPPRLVALSADGTILSLSLPDLKPTRPESPALPLGSAAVLSPTGRLVVMSFADRLEVFNAETGSSLQSIEISGTLRSAPSVSDDDERLAMTQADGTIQVVRLAQAEHPTTQQPSTLTLIADDQLSICWSGKDLLALGRDGRIRTFAGELLEIQTLGPTIPLNDVGRNADDVGVPSTFMCASPNGLQVGVAVGDRVWSWDRSSGLLAPIEISAATPRPTIGFLEESDSGGGKIITSGLARRLRIWDSSSGRPAFDLSGHAHAVWFAAGFTTTDTSEQWLASIDDKSVIKVWRPRRALWNTMVRAHSGEVASIGAMGQGLWWSSDQRGNAAFWQASRKGLDRVATLHGLSEDQLRGATACVMNDQGSKVAIGTATGGVYVHDLARSSSSGQEPTKPLLVPAPPGAATLRIAALSWLGDDLRVAASDTRGVAMWWSARLGEQSVADSDSANKGADQEVTSAIGRSQSGIAATDVAFSSDNRLVVLATASGELCRVWQENGEAADAESVADAPITSVDSSITGRYFAVATGDAVALIDNAPFGGLLAWLDTRSEADTDPQLTSVAVSSDGRMVLAGDSQGDLHIWDLWAFDADILGNLESNLPTSRRGANPSLIAALRSWADESLRHPEITSGRDARGPASPQNPAAVSYPATK